MTKSTVSEFITPNWTAPLQIGAVSTTRKGGVSKPPYEENNLALHVNDVAQDVLANRSLLKEALALPSEPVWLNQTHSNRCTVIDGEIDTEADAAVTRDKTRVLAIMTADCLPILLCNKAGSEIAAIHSGWRGLAQGIIENTLANMHSAPDTCIAWIGPAICSACYEIGPELEETFVKRYPFSSIAFKEHNLHKFADLPKIAQCVLKEYGITVYQSGHCTFEEKDRFYSYRRVAQTGRIATLIWFKQDK